MANSPIVYKYENTDISFLNENTHQMINATEMIKAFPNKRINDFLRLNQTKSFIKLLENKTGFPVLVVNNGGQRPGTLMHHKLGLKLASWLSDEFELWVYDRIEELLRQGHTTIYRPRRNEIHEHVNHQIQRENSKSIASELYGSNKNVNNIVKYYRYISYKMLGIYPNQIKKWAYENKVPNTIINKGSREILRYLSSSAPACMSLIENVITSNEKISINDIDDLIPIIEQLDPFFTKMIEIGHCSSDELEKHKFCEKIKHKLNEK